ncbi:MAG: hypothetical protein PQJ45_10810 [Sphaerochaetaceae bacterium]|nr:hypothetical protein [Sphaerochaetaceae bacterium]
MAKKIDPNSLYNSTPFKIVLIMISCFFLNYIAYFINDNSNPWQLLYLMPMLVTAFLFDTK